MTLRRKKLIPSFCFKLYLSRVYLWRKKLANSQKEREREERSYSRDPGSKQAAASTESQPEAKEVQREHCNRYPR